MAKSFVFSQLSELGRPFTGGSWCGTAGGVQQYFSETSTVTASVKVNLPEQNFVAINLSYQIPQHLRETQ